MSHCGVKRMIQNKKLLGDSFYPPILTEETARQIEEERIRREKLWDGIEGGKESREGKRTYRLLNAEGPGKIR